MITTMCETGAHIIRLDVNNPFMWVDEDGSTRCTERFEVHSPPAKYLVIGMVMDYMISADGLIGPTVTSLDYIDVIGTAFAKQTNDRAVEELTGKHHHPKKE